MEQEKKSVSEAHSQSALEKLTNSKIAKFAAKTVGLAMAVVVLYQPDMAEAGKTYYKPKPETKAELTLEMRAYLKKYLGISLDGRELTTQEHCNYIAKIMDTDAETDKQRRQCRENGGSIQECYSGKYEFPPEILKFSKANRACVSKALHGQITYRNQKSSCDDGTHHPRSWPCLLN